MPNISSPLILSSIMYELQGYTCPTHSNLPNIMYMATTLHMILKRSIMLTWMHDKRELVYCVMLWNNTKLIL